jgi:tetratricopeptide (TPR) repeat protein/ABC-type transporter Mla MlaB component
LLELGPPSREDLAPLLGAILPLGLADTDLTRGMKGEVRAENTRRLVADELRRISAERPTLLVLEDVQWADSASWAMLLHAVRDIDTVLIVITARPMADPPEELEQLRQLRRFRTIELDRFTRDEVRRLIRDRLGERAASDAVIDLVHERAEGHPFFTEELLHALSESGSLAELERLPAGAPRDEIESIVFGTAIPDTIRGLIHKRLDRLTAEQQLVLRSASVIGTHFEPELLRVIHPVPSDPAAVARHLAALVELDLIRLESPEPSARMLFRNRITREVAYHSMLFEQRRELHRKIAEWHEGREAPTARRYALLGHHWKGAGDTARASGWLGKAGEKALREHANRDAVRFLTEALELAGTDRSGREERARWHLLLGRAHVNMSRYEEALPHFEKGLARFGQRAPQSAMGALPPLLGQVAIQGLHRIWPDRYLGRRSGREDLLQLIDAHDGLGEAHYVGGRPVPTLLFTVRSLNLAETVGPSGALARSYASAGAIAGFVPLRGAAEAYIRRALETARRVEDPAAEAWVSLATGVYKAGIAAWEEAVELLERTRAISQRLGDRRRWEDATQHLATVAYLRGEFGPAFELARQLHASAAGEASRSSELDAPRGSEVHPVRQIAALRIEAACRLRLGNVQDLSGRIEELRRLVQDASDPLGKQRALVLAAVEAPWSVRRGRYDEARASIETALRDSPSGAVTSYESILDFWALLEALFAVVEVGGPPTGSRDAPERRVIKTIESHARVFLVCRPAARIARGLLSLTRGRSAAAREAFRRGARTAERLAMPWFEAIARYRLGRAMEEGDHARVDELERAYAIFQRLEASYDLELVRREGAVRRPAGAGSIP